LARAGWRVRIVAENTTNLVSDNAAGFFFPRTRKRATPEEREIFERLSIESYAAYLAIIRGGHPFIKQGPKMIPGYFGLDICPGFDVHIKEGLVASPEQVLIDFGNGKQYPAMEYMMVYTNPSEIMKELRAQIALLNIKITQSVVHSINDLEESIVFNCAGMGAKELASDDRMVPVQGHLIMLKDQPDKEQLQYMINVSVPSVTPQGFPRDEFVYYAPKESGILGVTFLRGGKAMQANDHEFDRMIERSRNYFGE
jgi:hypothetical protein